MSLVSRGFAISASVEDSQGKRKELNTKLQGVTLDITVIDPSSTNPPNNPLTDYYENFLGLCISGHAIYGEHLSKLLDADKKIDDRLKAQNFGVLEGKTFDEIHADPELAKNMWDYIPPEERTDYRAPLAESNRDLIGRIVEVRKDLYTRNESPLVITHGSVIDVIVSIHEKARLDALEGVNRRFEGRVIEDTWQGISPIGQPGEQFDHIPGTEKAIAEGDAEALKRALLAYISSASVDEEERIHLAKLINFI